MYTEQFLRNSQFQKSDGIISILDLTQICEMKLIAKQKKDHQLDMS